MNGLPRRNASSMATLQQTLRGLPQADDQITRGPGGVLQQKKTLQQATQQAGLAAAPLTPLAAQMTGADEQAAKMAGTPQQLQAALKQATEPMELQTALRRKPVRTEATAAELQTIQKSGDMQKLGGLGDRVTNLIKDEYKKLSSTAVDLLAVTEYLGKPLAPIADKLLALKNNPQDMNAQLAVAEYFGKALDPIGEVPKLFKSTAESVGTAAAGAVRDLKDIPISEIIGDLGYDIPSLSGLLGIAEADLQKYSVEDLQAKVNQLSSEEFSASQQLQQTATSRLVGAAERGLAREAGRELSATGIGAAEADVQGLVDAVNSSDQITFLGQTKSYRDWLADEEISAMIKEVVESPEGSKLRTDLEKNYPEFYSFVKNNEGSLKLLTSSIQTGATQFKQIQDKNKKFLEDSGLSDAALKIYADKFTGLLANEIKPTDIPVVDYISTLKSDDEKKKFSDTLNTIVSTDPKLAAEINDLSKDQLIALGIGQPESNWSKMTSYNQRIDEIGKIKDSDYDRLIGETFSDVSSLELAQENIKTGNILKTLGLDSGVSVTSLDPESLKKNLLDGKTKISVVDAAAGNVPEWKKQKLGAPKFPTAGVDYDLISKLGNLLQDGSLTSEEIYAAGSPVQSLNLDELIRLESLSGNGKSSIDRGAIRQLRSHRSNQYTRSEFEQTKGASSAVDTAVRMAESDPSGKKVDKELLGYFIEQELMGEQIMEFAGMAKQAGGVGNVSRPFRGFAERLYNKLEKALRAGVLSPKMTQAYYDMRGGEVPVFNM